MIDEDDFSWDHHDKSWRVKHDMEIAEADRQCALKLVALIKEKANGANSARLKQSDIKKVIHCKAPGVYGSLLNPVSCAKKLNMIEIDEFTRPFTYTLTENFDEKVFELRPYQTHIIHQAKVAESSVLIEAPTGSGKSVMASEIAKDETVKGGKVLIVAPKIILLEQLQETFAALDPQIIHGAKDYNTEHNVFISTLQTAYKRELGFEPTMILIDEVHHGFSGKMIEQLLKNFKGRLIGLSATPYDQNGLPLSGFDLHIDEYDVKYMLVNGYLVPPVSYAPVKVDLKGITTVAGDYSQSELDQRFNTHSDIMKIVEHTKEKIMQSKAALIFCINIDHAAAIAKIYNGQGVPTRAIHSNLSKAEQKEIMTAYKSGEIKLLANPMLLTTGFDYPATDCIVLARATRSQNLYKQLVGRALRLSKGKTQAMILDCAGVIDNLGLPTDPIDVKMQIGSNKKSVCESCESERLYRKVLKNRTYMVCADCGAQREVEQKATECEKCGIILGKDASFFIENEQLYVICSSCEHHTLVSVTDSQEQMREIFDSSYVEALQKKAVLTILEYWMNEYGSAFILQKKVTEHLKAFHVYITRHPDLFVAADSYDIRRIKDFNQSRIEDPNMDDNTYMTRGGHNWRLFGKEMEEHLLYAGIADLQHLLRISQSLQESFALVNKIRSEKGEELIEDEFIDSVMSRVKKSSLDGINAMTNKRLKDIYFEGGSLSELKDFVKLMESVLLK